MSPGATVRRALALVRRPGLREVAVFAAAYLTYFGVRAFTQENFDAALDHALDLVRLEAALRLDWERDLQAALLGYHGIVDAANAVYMYGHWPVIITGGILLFRFRHAHYVRLRNAYLLTAAVGLVVFAVFPVAPPRLAGVGIIDTVTRHASGYRQLVPPSLVNEYAAMPSFHAGWNLLLGIVVFDATRSVPLRLLAVGGPASMIVSVVLTGNHFVVDVIAGAAICLVALLVVRRLESRPAGRTVVPHVSVRRRPPGGQRSRAPARSRAAARAAGRG